MRTASMLALVGLSATVAGCGGGTKTVTSTIGDTTPAASTTATTPATTAASTTSADATTTTTAASGADANKRDPITVKGKKGDTLTLYGSGLSGGSHVKAKLKVTVKAVRGPFSGFNLPAGRKLIGVDMRISNIGTTTYKDYQPGGTLIVSSGETGKQTNLISGSGKSPCDNPRTILKPGQSKDVCVAFDVPKASSPKSFEYVADVGYGDTGFWTLS